MKLPVVIRLNEHSVHEADLKRELKINQFNLDKELIRQPSKYIWWAVLYAEVSAKATELRDRLEVLEAKLSRKYRKANGHSKVTDIKLLVRRNKNYVKLLNRVRGWERSEAILKYAERAFSQRKDVLMALNANVRKEKSSN